MKRSVHIKFFVALFFMLAIFQYCKHEIGDFELKQVVSDLENRPEWQLSAEPIQPLLEQTFSFFGSGDQAYAFLGEDKTTILKLFKHYDAQGKRPLDHVFASCMLAFKNLKEETGLIYLHLNKTAPHFITLIDKLGFSHTLDINATEYALQKKADALIFSTFEQLFKKNEIDRVKQSIDSLFALIASRCSKGIGDKDTALRRNYGYLNHQPLAIDIGSYFPDDSLKEPSNAQKEIAHKTKRLFRWLKKHHPELLPYYHERLGLIKIINAA